MPEARAQVFECGIENSEHFYNLMNMCTMTDGKQGAAQAGRRALAVG